MADSIPEELRSFGVTSKDFDEKKGVLSKTMGSNVDEKEVFFSLFQDLATKAINYQILQMLYCSLALYEDKLGQDSFEFQQKSHQSRLLDLKQYGKTRDKINGNGRFVPQRLVLILMTSNRCRQPKERRKLFSRNKGNADI